MGNKFDKFDKLYSTLLERNVQKQSQQSMRWKLNDELYDKVHKYIGKKVKVKFDLRIVKNKNTGEFTICRSVCGIELCDY